jgi:AraC-like DNA-binding protein
MKGQPARIHSATIDTARQSSAHVRVRQRYVSVGPVTVGDITMQTDVVMEADDIGGGYYVHLPVMGRLELRHAGATLRATREVAAVFAPGGGSFTGQWEAGCRVMCVRLDGDAVDAALKRLPGWPPRGELPSAAGFELAMDTRGGPGRTWVEQLLVLSRQPDGPDGLLANPLVARPLAESLVNGFLLAAASSAEVRKAVSAAAAAALAAGQAMPPATVRKAIDLIEADPQLPVSVSDLAIQAGVGARALQHGFRHHVGMSPMAYLRDVRLRRADADLRAGAGQEDTVASIALRWGFTHPGRFAAAYEAKYGQPPGRTLRAGR